MPHLLQASLPVRLAPHADEHPVSVRCLTSQRGERKAPPVAHRLAGLEQDAGAQLRGRRQRRLPRSDVAAPQRAVLGLPDSGAKEDSGACGCRQGCEHSPSTLVTAARRDALQQGLLHAAIKLGATGTGMRHESRLLVR